MQLNLVSIGFAVPGLPEANRALLIRLDRDHQVPFPEYQSSASNAEEIDRRPTAYAIEDVAQGTGPIIRLEIGTTEPLNGYHVRASGGGILGAVAEFPVTFVPPGPPPISHVVHVPLAHAQISAIGRHEIEWQWEFKVDGADQWQPLKITRHLIYVTVARPTAPWTLGAGDKTLVWANLLDHACSKSAGLWPTNRWRIMRQLTHALNQQYGFRYDITRGGKAQWGFKTPGTLGEDRMFLQECIERALGNNPSTAPHLQLCDPSGQPFPVDLTVGCFDVAALLVLMAAALGLEASYNFHQPLGFLNVVKPIGREWCNDPFYFLNCVPSARIRPDDPQRHFYDNHTYAKFQGGVFDACMRYQPAAPKNSVLDPRRLIGRMIEAALALRPDWDATLRAQDRATGLVAGLSQSEYEKRLIDKSTPLEEHEATGTPVEFPVQFFTEPFQPG